MPSGRTFNKSVGDRGEGFQRLVAPPKYIRTEWPESSRIQVNMRTRAWPLLRWVLQFDFCAAITEEMQWCAWDCWRLARPH